MQQPADALEIVDGEVVRKRLPLPALHDAWRDRQGTGAGLEAARRPRAPGLTAEGWFYSDHMTYPYGVHVAVVRVDRDTGAIDDRALPHRL